MGERKPYSWLFYAYAIEGWFALVWLLLIPSEGGQITPARFALIGALLLLSGSWSYLGYRPPKDPDGLARPLFIYGSAALSLTLGLVLFLLRYLNPDRLLPVYERLSPLLWYSILLAIQSFIFLLFLRKGYHPSRLTRVKPVYGSAAISLAILLGLFAFISITRLGITFDPAYWGEPGVPVLGWQFVLALLTGSLVFALAYYLRRSPLDAILPLFLYLLAVTLWLSVPFEVLKNSFYMRISAPTFIPFPYSDSSYYDQMAQSLLIGHPYQGIIPTRPLYIVFLTVLHLVFRENYPNILTGQTFVLASMPVALYFLGKKLHSRAAGVTIAMIFIFRELTSLLISSDTRVTNTRMILVDLPTLLLLLVSCIFTFRWLERKNPKDAFVAGGLFGVLLLLRTQSMQILPLIFVAALFVLGWRNRRFYLQGFLFIVGLAITITPWLIHNYLQTGSPAFDAAFQLKLVVAQYSAFGNLDVSNYNFEGMGLGRILLEFMIRDPKHVFGFISNHFLASQINSLLVLPLIEPFNGLFKPINLYWMNWDGSLDWYNAVLLIVYLVIISIGLGAAWRRWRWLGLLPLVYSVGYALATALARFSSWRYDFPSDWIAYFYFGIGFAELLRHAALLVGEADPAPDTLTVTEKQNAGHPYVIPALALVFILIGSLPWMIKGITSPKYPDQSPDGLSARISTVDQSPPREEIEAFVSQPGSFIQVGRLLYPRFFPKDAGLVSANPSPAYAIREYPRLGFFLLNQHSTPVVFPTRSFRSPMLHAEDVIVLGCQRGSYVEARAIILPDLDLYYAGIPLTTPCSP